LIRVKFGRGAADRGECGEAAGAVAEGLKRSELIVLRDDRSEIGKSKHYVKHEQQTDCAKDRNGC
jgi:hypothetical protein